MKIKIFFFFKFIMIISKQCMKTIFSEKSKARKMSNLNESYKYNIKENEGLQLFFFIRKKTLMEI